MTIPIDLFDFFQLFMAIFLCKLFLYICNWQQRTLALALAILIWQASVEIFKSQEKQCSEYKYVIKQ